ncbi:hypothetical protein PPTG_23114 [Phytophthora nicotianae INRA-310]|uniref:Uncharacterized protein n=1 Tax=Phytophthora nicotianae (strain INRA-310) TaxID=761204 RepID=W2Q525_PHYN3|nr:hypothetical protein PPTG_23114 [Phytophthora nicotianae INRA-310]ETN07976.1 hypothetical protein PPTG_23114 [Phytophthora nicotianae INRA-310]
MSTAIRAPNIAVDMGEKFGTLVATWRMQRSRAFDEIGMVLINDHPLHPLEDLHRPLIGEAMGFECIVIPLGFFVGFTVPLVARSKTADKVGVACSRGLLADVSA